VATGFADPELFEEEERGLRWARHASAQVWNRRTFAHSLNRSEIAFRFGRQAGEKRERSQHVPHLPTPR
jgi:hypothetical protein